MRRVPVVGRQLLELGRLLQRLLVPRRAVPDVHRLGLDVRDRRHALLRQRCLHVRVGLGLPLPVRPAPKQPLERGEARALPSPDSDARAASFTSHALLPDGADAPTHAPVLRMAVWLAIGLAATKVASFYNGELALSQRVDLPPVVAVAFVSYKDVLFALRLGLLGEGVRRAVPTRHARTVERGFLIVSGACLFYAVVGFAVHRALHRPLTLALLLLVRDAALARSSVAERVTPLLLFALVVGPFALAALAGRAARRQGPPRFALACAIAWTALGARAAPPQQERWKQLSQEMARLSLSPHLELLRSAIQALTARRPAFGDASPADDVTPLRTMRARGYAGSATFHPDSDAPRPRNVILVTLESVGTKYMSLYGSPYATTPELVAEASHAIVFDGVYAHAAQTYWSARALTLSVYPGLPWCILPCGDRGAPPALATLLHERGYRTAFLHNGTLRWLHAGTLLGERYEQVEDYTDWGSAPLTSWGAEDRASIDRLIGWIDEQPGRPFMAHVWTDQTHDPYRESPGAPAIEFLAGKPPPHHAAELARYLDVLHGADAQLARLFAALRERGLADDTLVVITGDHGEAFADPHSDRGHGLTVHEEELRVPLMFWNPRLFAGGRRVDTIGGHVDVNPTITDVLGVTPAADWQGSSLFDRDRPRRAYFAADYATEYLFGVREGRWKYVWDATNAAEHLFDLSDDPEELTDVAPLHPDDCRRMHREVATWVSYEEAFLAARRD